MEAVSYSDIPIRSILSYERGELADYLREEFGFSKYRADQIFQWIYQKGATEASQMTNIGKRDRERLERVLSIPETPFSDRQISVDGTRKYLFSVEQSDQVESVMIKQPTRMTLCVSSQVGCALGCKFCQTGTMGLKRHLSTEEILFQVMGVIRDAKENFDDMFTNMVFMGMGEPLHNFESVSKAIRILNDTHGLALSARKITVSTAGLVPAIDRFFKEDVGANLAVSMNATTNEVRSEIMPINKRYSLEQLLDSLRNAPVPNRKRITIEYVMLKGVNDTADDLARLPRLLKGIPAKINLIPYNTNVSLGFETPDEQKVHMWQKELMKHHFVTTIRWSKGRDIDAACGQLVTQSKRQKKNSLSTVH